MPVGVANRCNKPIGTNGSVANILADITFLSFPIHDSQEMFGGGMNVGVATHGQTMLHLQEFPSYGSTTIFPFLHRVSSRQEKIGCGTTCFRAAIKFTVLTSNFQLSRIRVNDAGGMQEIMIVTSYIVSSKRDRGSPTIFTFPTLYTISLSNPRSLASHVC